MKKVLFRLVSATILVLTIFVIGSVKAEAQLINSASNSFAIVSPSNGDTLVSSGFTTIEWTPYTPPPIGSGINLDEIYNSWDYGLYINGSGRSLRIASVSSTTTSFRVNLGALLPYLNYYENARYTISVSAIRNSDGIQTQSWYGTLKESSVTNLTFSAPTVNIITPYIMTVSPIRGEAGSLASVGVAAKDSSLRFDMQSQIELSGPVGRTDIRTVTISPLSNENPASAVTRFHFMVPNDLAPGDYIISVKSGKFGGTTNTTKYTVLPKLPIASISSLETSSYGVVGSLVTIKGSSFVFEPHSMLYLVLDGPNTIQVTPGRFHPNGTGVDFYIPKEIAIGHYDVYAQYRDTYSTGIYGEKSNSVSLDVLATSTSIISISPSAGSVNTPVTLTGTGFSANNTDNEIFIGNGYSIPNVRSLNNGTQINFTIPNHPSFSNLVNLPIMLINRNIRGGAIAETSYTLLQATSTVAPTISGLTAPTVLSVGQMGTWTVKASDQNNGSLSYSVKWGDEGRARLAGSESFVQTSTFTHTYSVAGTYKPTFTVKNEAGLSAETSATVQVGSSTNCYTFTTNLTIGSTGADVVALQDLLIAKGFGIVKIQTGETPKGYFGEDTKNAVLLYQKSIGIDSTGFVGPLTRASLNADSCNSSNGVTVSGAIANVGSPIISNDRNVAYPASFKFTLNNLKDNAVYIYKDLSKFLRLNEKGGPSDVKIDIIVASPSMLAGDSEKVIIIPAGASRTFTINAILRDFSDEEKTELKVVKIVGLSYFDSLNSQNPNVIEKGLEKLSLSIAMDSIKIPPSPSLSVLSPVGERTYKFGSTIQIAWNAQSVDADYYYALLENTAIQNLGVVVTGNLPTTSTSTSFVFNKNVLDTFIAKGGGLTEEQLRNRYYIRVIGMKNGTSGSRPVINNVSGIFGVSTFESDKGVTVSGAKAVLGAPIMSGNNAVAYPVNFNFTMNNLSNGPIYVSTDAKYTTHIEYNSQTPSNVRFASTTALPGSLSGDSSDVFVIPSGASRSFNVFAVLRNYSGVTEQKTVKVSVIQYLTNRASQSYEMVREGLENLRVSLVMDGVASTTGTSTIPVVVICPVGYICNPVGSSYQCPSGYTCSVATLNCPFGYICTALVPKTGTSSVTISKVTLDSYPVYGYVLKVFGTGFDLSNNAVYIDGKRLEFCKTCSPEQGVRPYEGAIQITTDKKRILETLSIKPGVYDLQVQNLATKAYSNKLKIDLTYVSKTEPVVSSPNGGEIFTIGGTIPVTFNSISGFTYELGLIDRRNINDVYYILNSNVVGTGGLQTVRFKTPPGVNSGSKFKVSAFCKNSACDPDTDSSNNYFTITSSTTPPIQTPVITPVPQVNATLSASLLSTNTDRASGRLDGSGFAPGVGWVAGSFDPSDWNWSINLNLMAEKKISSVTVRQTNGEYWSTDNNKQWPLVIVDSVGKQLNSRYTSDFGSFRSGQYNWTLYGQKNTPTWVGGYVTVVFSDGTKVSADISIPAPVACPVGYICNPVNNSSSYCPTGYVCNSVTTNCPAGYTCTTKILKSSLATPVPTPYYSPAPTPYYYSTPVPTPVPTATATPAPTATPYITPSPAPAPSSAPVTTSTPSPSSTPYSTPRPSTSPSPSSSPSAMSAEYDRLQASIWQAVAEWFMGR